MAEVDAIIISTEKNLIYFSDEPNAKIKARGVFLFLIGKKKIVLTNSIEKFNVPLNLKTIVYEKREDLENHFREILKGCRKVGIEGGCSFAFYKKLKKWLPKRKFVDVSDWILKQRSVKKPFELEKIKIALEIAETGMKNVLKKVRPGMSEEKIELMLKQEFMKRGCDTNFCIVQADSNTAKIHRHSSRKKLKRILLLDLGPAFQNYSSDITRTFFFGKQTREEERVYSAVLRAQKAAMEKVKPGAKASEIYLAAKNSLGEWAEYFTHGLGHGIGLDYHELPSLSENSEDVIKEGMIFTIEPGVYLPEKFGVRIEDVVLVTKKGYKLLTGFKK